MVESDDRASDPKTARETARWLKIMFRFADDSMMVLLFDWISRSAFLYHIGFNGQNEGGHDGNCIAGKISL